MALGIQCFGLVQGVFFRASTKQEADYLGIKGWVRNEPDGSVLIHAQGSNEQLKTFLKWCTKGPIMAQVSEVRSWEKEDELCYDFRIIRD